MSTDFSWALGAWLRAIRNQQGLSLQGVEDESHGRWKAVVVGSFERGDRAATVQRISELEVSYGVPVSELLRDPRPSSAVTSKRGAPPQPTLTRARPAPRQPPAEPQESSQRCRGWVETVASALARSARPVIPSLV